MLPTLEIGSWHLNTYSFLYVLALLVAGMYGFHRLLAGLERPPELVIRGTFLAILGGFGGAYAVRAFLTLQYFVQSGDLTWSGGSSFVGVLLGGVGVGILYCRHHRIPLPRALDLAAPALALGQAVGRLGCLAAGCCYGRPADAWLGLVLPDADGLWVSRYPTQLMAAAADLLILATLLILERRGKRRPGQRRPFDGLTFLLYLSLYCLKRFALEFLRGDAIPAVGGLSWAQLYTLAGLLAAATLIVWNLRRKTTYDSLASLSSKSRGRWPSTGS